MFEVDTFETSAGELKITFVGHGTLMFTLGDTVVHVDPVSSEADYTKMPKADLILVTHEHRAHLDPAAIEKARTELSDVTFCSDPYEAARDSDTLVILTEWDEFADLDMERIKDLLNYPILVDGRNIFDPERMRNLGFEYLGVGRGASG